MFLYNPKIHGTQFWDQFSDFIHQLKPTQQNSVKFPGKLPKMQCGQAGFQEMSEIENRLDQVREFSYGLGQGIRLGGLVREFSKPVRGLGQRIRLGSLVRDQGVRLDSKLSPVFRPGSAPRAHSSSVWNTLRKTAPVQSLSLTTHPPRTYPRITVFI